MKTVKSIIAAIPHDEELCFIYPYLCAFVRDNEVNLNKVVEQVENLIIREGFKDIYSAADVIEIQLQTPETDE